MAFSDEPFPLMGFPNESNDWVGSVIYSCEFAGGKIVMWRESFKPEYHLNLYRLDATEYNAGDRICRTQLPLKVSDVLEAQLAIFYLVQTYLPTEVTDGSIREVPTDASAG
jgi:hypothetical protein